MVEDTDEITTDPFNTCIGQDDIVILFFFKLSPVVNVKLSLKIDTFLEGKSFVGCVPAAFSKRNI